MSATYPVDLTLTSISVSAPVCRVTPSPTVSTSAQATLPLALPTTSSPAESVSVPHLWDSSAENAPTAPPTPSATPPASASA